MVGSGAVTFRVTLTLVEPGAPPEPATRTVPVYVPVERPAVLIETFTVPGVVPLAGETTSQLPVLDAVAVKARAAEPPAVTLSGCDAGAASPAR